MGMATMEHDSAIEAALTAPSRAAVTAQPIAHVLANRWSPRSYASGHAVSESELEALLEAARWAPSSKNSQARRFVVGRRGGELFARISATLHDKNMLWAPNASLLIVGVLVRIDGRGRDERFAEYDLGQAVAHMAVQAESLDLRMRQIGGFDREGLAEALGLQHPYEPFIVAAVGRQAEADELEEELAERERAPRTRLPLSELILARDGASENQQ